VPVYRLLGGPTRERVRVYAHWGIRDLSEQGLQQSRERLERLQASGYTAYKSGPPGTWRAHEPPSVIDTFIKCAYLMREWVGPDVELCFDFHGKMTPALAAEICHELRGMRPMFVEEPVPQENVGALKRSPTLARSTTCTSCPTAQSARWRWRRRCMSMRPCPTS
jgi:galactonate dehydratase